jgi:hypothetical protein
MTRREIAGALVLLAGWASGCSNAVRKPRLLHPGPAPFQRGNAEVSDPFPLPDMGPEIVGGRPREFDQPRNEVVRAQQFLRSAAGRPSVLMPVAPVPVGPPTPVTQPYPAPPYGGPPTTPLPAGPRY